MSNVIFYFSGTGNSLNIAREIGKLLSDTKLIKIHETQDEINASGYDRVGIVYPVYYYQMPVLVEEFVKKLIITKEQYVFGIATYGGMRGRSLIDLRSTIEAKGCTLDAEFSVVMPGNYIVKYNAFPDGISRFILKKSKITAAKIADSIRLKEKTRPTKIRGFEKGFLSSEKNRTMILDIRQGFAQEDKSFICSETCTGCGACEKICPAKNIVMQENRPVWQHRCEQCLACLQWCPNRSIDYLQTTQKRTRYHHPEVTLKDMMKDSF